MDYEYHVVGVSHQLLRKGPKHLLQRRHILLQFLRSRIECDPHQPSANTEVILPGSRMGPADEGTLSKLMAAGSI